MSLHEISPYLTARRISAVSITRRPYQGPADLMRVGLWIKSADGGHHCVAWEMTTDKDVVERVTGLLRHDVYDAFHVLDSFRETCERCDHVGKSCSRTVRDLRDEAYDWDDWLSSEDFDADRVRDDDVVAALSIDTLAEIYASVGVRYELWRDYCRSGLALVPDVPGVTYDPEGTRLPIVTWDTDDIGRVDDFACDYLNPICLATTGIDKTSAIGDLLSIYPLKACILYGCEWRTSWAYPDNRDWEIMREWDLGQEEVAA